MAGYSATFLGSVSPLSPPDVRDYKSDYMAYLQHYEAFLAFMDKFKGLRSADTFKPVKIPSRESLTKTLERVRGRLPAKSDDDGSDWTRATTPAPGPQKPVAVVAKPVSDTKRKLVDEALNRVPVPVTYPNLMGKKKCVTLLKQYCSTQLAEFIVKEDKLNRTEDGLNGILAQLERKVARSGGAKLEIHRLSEVGLGPRPDDMPGMLTDAHYDAIWESGASGQEGSQSD
jgi:hypothetical protein